MTRPIAALAWLLAWSIAAEASAGPAADLVAALADPDHDIRSLAATLLAERPRAVPGAGAALLALARDPAEPTRVRADAARALAVHGTEESIPALVSLALARDLDWRVRVEALTATLALGGEAPLRRASDRAPPELAACTPWGPVRVPPDDCADTGTLARVPDARVQRLARALRARCPQLRAAGRRRLTAGGPPLGGTGAPTGQAPAVSDRACRTPSR